MPEAARWRLRPAAGSGWRARAGYPTRRGREGRRLDLLAPGGGSSGEARAGEGGAVEAPPLPPLSPAGEREESGLMGVKVEGTRETSIQRRADAWL